MKKSLLALILACACGVSLAATQNIQASGTIGTTCTFTNAVDGTLAVNPSNPSVIATTQAAGGLSAAVNLSYLGTPTVSVALPSSFTSAPAGVSAMSPVFSVSGNSQNLGALSPAEGGGVAGTYSTGSSDVISVDMGATLNGNVPTGSYILGTVVTCQ